MPTSAPERTTVVAWAAPLLLVSLAHFAALAWLSSTAHRPVQPVVPSSIAGKLVSAPAPPTPTEVPVKPEPPPPRPAPPKPTPAPREVPKPLPPTPSGPPSPRAVTAPPPERPVVQQTAAQPATATASTPPAASPAPQAEAREVPQAVTPPRSDAAHLNNPPPPYPSLSRRLREEGRVVLDVYILADGRVGEIRLRRSSGHPRLDEVALDAVRRWRYVPARRGDEPIPFWYVQPVDFRLDS
jgi:periplasmic protein TonB